MKNIISTVKGTREFYPREMTIRTWLYNQIRTVSEAYGYQEYDGPFLESIDLYAAKSGEELVKEQSFVFPDRGGNLIALRPELTPSLARMVAQQQNELVFPLRWWSFGPFWRYERPQKGRTREFFQWNIDLLGVNTPEADAEVVSICANFFAQLGLSSKEVKILINDRKLMEAELTSIGIPSGKEKLVFKLIDRKDKMGQVDWEKYISESGLTKDQNRRLQGLLEDKMLFKKSDELNQFFKAVESLGFGEYVQFDPAIIRGLDYYTGIVFEAKDMGEEGRAILGGGHYDNLVSDVGGNLLPGVGFAMGDVVLQLILERYGKLKEVKANPADILVTVFDVTLMDESLRLAVELRKSGLRVVCYPAVAKLEKQMKFADRSEVNYVLILGPDEIMGRKVNIKDLKKSSQIQIIRENIAQTLKSMLAEG